MRKLKRGHGYLGTIAAISLIALLIGNGKALLGVLVIFGGAYAGIVLGGALGKALNRHVVRGSADPGDRLKAAGSVFGFLSLPAAVGALIEAQSGITILQHGLGAHLLWACIAAAVGFWLSKRKTNDAQASTPRTGANET